MLQATNRNKEYQTVFLQVGSGKGESVHLILPQMPCYDLNLISVLMERYIEENSKYLCATAETTHVPCKKDPCFLRKMCTVLTLPWEQAEEKGSNSILALLYVDECCEIDRRFCG